MAGIPFCVEIIHQEQIKLKKITIITLLLITALAVHGCGNKKNVSDNETVKETASLVIQQETVRLSTQETTTEQITESETALEETKTSAGVEIADYSQISDETAPQTVELDNNSFAAGYSAASQYSQLVIVQSHGTRATVTMHPRCRAARRDCGTLARRRSSREARGRARSGAGCRIFPESQSGFWQ